MLSKILEIQNHKINVEKKPSRRPSPFPKEEKRRTLSKKLQEGSLSALKEMLSKQKQEAQMGAAGPFQEIPTMQQVVEAAGSLKIDPSAQVMQLYHKMVDTLLHIHREGIQETTFFLDSDAFSSSIFHGAKITITEYSTAPKIFNIHFFADGKALAIFEAHAHELVNSLQNGKFGFGVHRLDTSLLTEDEKHAIPPVERDLEKEKDNPQ
ncbi:MAG: hypothetical protein K1000chlam3_01095 [Chlamydiae bacterium]|nr:hypothetical protein [Chlamydiota bacterium]